MINIFWGVFFIIFNFHVDIGIMHINLLPEFVGFYILSNSIEELEARLGKYSFWPKLALIGSGLSALSWLINILPLGIFPTIGSIFQHLYMIIFIILLIKIYQLFREIEDSEEVDINAYSLKIPTFIMAANLAISQIGDIFLTRKMSNGNFSNIETGTYINEGQQALLVFIIIIIFALYLIISIVYLVKVRKIEKNYYFLLPED